MRLSIGLEDPADIIADLAQALAGVPVATPSVERDGAASQPQLAASSVR